MDKTTFQAEIEVYFTNNKYEGIFKYMKEYLNNGDIFNSIIRSESRYNRSLKQLLDGLITLEYHNIEVNKINEALTQILTDDFPEKSYNEDFKIPLLQTSENKYQSKANNSETEEVSDNLLEKERNDKIGNKDSINICKRKYLCLALALIFLAFLAFPYIKNSYLAEKYKESPYLSAKSQEYIHSMIDELTIQLEQDFSNRIDTVDYSKDTTDNLSIWTIAEIYIALNKTDVASYDRYHQCARKMYSKPQGWSLGMCGCRADFRITPIVLLALISNANEFEYSSTLKFMLDNIGKNGWNGVQCDSGPNENFDNVYATCFCSKAIWKIKKKYPEYAPEIDRALERPILWLNNLVTSDKEGKKFKLKMYPKSKVKRKGIALGALTVHTLNQIMDSVKRKERVSKEWLNLLLTADGRKELDNPINGEFYSKTCSKFINDFTSLPIKPWAFIATVDAYRYGNNEQRKAANEWLNESIKKLYEDEFSYIKSDEDTESYDMAQYLIALKYLKGIKCI